MNIAEAQRVLELKAMESNRKRDFRHAEERLKFLQKWVIKYSSELAEVKEWHAKARNRIKNLPSDSAVRAAEKVLKEFSEVDKEIKRLKKRKEKYVKR